MTDSPAEDGTEARPVPFISRVRLKNYKSIAECDVHLGPLTILVGPNGSGKSNFLDALAFLSRAVATTLAEAIDERGGVGEIIRRVPERAESFSIDVEGSLREANDFVYRFAIGRNGQLLREECRLKHARGFTVYGGRTRHGSEDELDIGTDRLYLPITRQSGALASPLRQMQFYNFDDETLRKPQQPTARSTLGHSGEHLGDTLSFVADPYRKRIDAYLRAIVPNIDGVKPFSAGGYTAVALRATTGQQGQQIEFGPQAMSDGTVRAVGVLTAIFQRAVVQGRVPLVGIEEPETALHPGAAGVLFDALTEASEHVQLIAISQSADLLDREDLDVSTIRPVTMRNGLTIIGEVDDASREIVERKLYTLGELMRGNQLTPGEA